LSIRADNADQRLTGKGVEIGCVGTSRASLFAEKQQALELGRGLLQQVNATPTVLRQHNMDVNLDGARRSAWDLLSYPNMTMDRLGDIGPDLKRLDKKTGAQLEIEGLYTTYLARQTADIEAFRRDENLFIPVDMVFEGIPGLSREVIDKLNTARPATLGAAARISGMTPAALTVLLAEIRRNHRRCVA